jgi:hypothetical protein
MTFKCAWCEGTIRDLGGKAGISYGICPDCRTIHFPETLRSVQENGKAIARECLRAIGKNA